MRSQQNNCCDEGDTIALVQATRRVTTNAYTN